MKYKPCPKCQHRNISYASICEQCNTNIQSVVPIEKEGHSSKYNLERDNSLFCFFIGILSWVSFASGIISCLVILLKFTWIENPISYYSDKIFNPVGLGLAIGLLFSGLVYYAILSGIKRILE